MNTIDHNSQILIYSANRFDGTGNRKFVGGFADRLKGICFTFALSKIINRQFFIDWDNRSKLEDIFAANEINWELPESIKNDFHKFQTFNLIDDFFTGELKATIKNSPLDLDRRIFNNASAVVLNCNSLNFELFEPHGLLLQAYGIDTASARSFFRSIVDLLFSDRKIQDFPGYQDFIKFKSSVNVVIGAQFRTGGDGQWHDPVLDSIENSEVFSQSILDYARKMKLRDYGVFLSTDSQIAKQRIARYLAGKVHFFCYSAPPVHLERSEQPEASSGAMQVALEHTALSRSDYVIVGAGEFGVTAAYRGDKTPIFYKSICPPIGWARLPWGLRRKIREFRRRFGN
jgi:hypothetical protein